jgi:aminoglycoside 6'-N-acetyltransferase I
VTLSIRPALPSDAPSWLELRKALWPHHTEDQHASEIARFFTGETPWAAVLLAIGAAGRIVGFAELSFRPWAEGCQTSPVAYLEGWFVVPEARRQGVGRALIRAGEAWGRAQGCTELASDTHPENHTSAAAHRALGFSEAGLVLCFRKDL